MAHAQFPLLRFKSLTTTAKHVRYYQNTSRNFFFHKATNDSGPSLSSYAAKAPTKDLPSWKRLAEQIKDGDEVTDSIYMARLRSNHDVRDHVEKIEEEILEEMASALGRTGDKCNYHFYLLEKQGQICDQTFETAKSKTKKDKNSYNLVLSEVAEFNRLLKLAEQVRREVIIHRQAIGFQTGNYLAIERAWPLPSRRFVEVNGDEFEVREATGTKEEHERNAKWLEHMNRLRK
mmetsp:Transcript_9797/g.12866  ORF Transcript_9797/g.12866 Transcript_9797/m.12866 type:complete len:233 (-) Transcript_9797:71-769(-)